MFEIFLNAARLALSDDARKTATSLIDLVSRAPAWRQDVCTLDATIDLRNRERAYLIRDLAIEKLTTLSFPSETIHDFQTVFQELSSNAFEHGCTRLSPFGRLAQFLRRPSFRSEAVGLILEVSKSFVTLSVLNPPGHTVDAPSIVQRQRVVLKKNPARRRGRGLILVADLADTMEALPNNIGLKVVFHKDRVRTRHVIMGDLAALKLTSGLFNPSMPRRLLDEARDYLDYDLILDFSDWIHCATEVFHVMIDLSMLYAARRRRVVAIAPSRVGLGQGHVVASWQQALSALEKPTDSPYPF